MLNIGCVSSVTSTFDSVKNSITTNKPQQIDPLYGQVPDADKERVNKLEHELQVIEQTHVISKLEGERDELQRERSENNEKRLQLLQQEQQIRVQLSRVEAIDKNQLGDRIENIESITDLHVDAIKIQQKRLKYQGEVAVLDVKLEKIEVAIQAEQDKLIKLTGNEETNTVSN